MSEQRTPREADSRTNEARPPDTWVPPSILPEPNPIPGISFRWIRISAQGNSDDANVSQRFREGWEPVKAADHPELKLPRSSNRQTSFKDGVEVGGLLLCKMPTEMLKQREAYYQQQTTSQMTAVDTGFMRENDKRMPLLEPERKSRVSKFGTGGD